MLFQLAGTRCAPHPEILYGSADPGEDVAREVAEAEKHVRGQESGCDLRCLDPGEVSLDLAIISADHAIGDPYRDPQFLLGKSVFPCQLEMFGGIRTVAYIESVRVRNKGAPCLLTQPGCQSRQPLRPNVAGVVLFSEMDLEGYEGVFSDLVVERQSIIEGFHFAGEVLGLI